jgi:hypothetical protein
MADSSEYGKDFAASLETDHFPAAWARTGSLHVAYAGTIQVPRSVTEAYFSTFSCRLALSLNRLNTSYISCGVHSAEDSYCDTVTSGMCVVTIRDSMLPS